MTTSVRAGRLRPASAAARLPVAPRFRSGLGREVVSFAAIGVASTAAYAVLYLALRTVAGPAAANAAALLATAIGNTAANRRLTFGVRGRGSMLRDQLGGLAALGVALAITTASIAALGALSDRPGRLVELAVVVVANALATIVRFVLLRAWIRGDRSRTPRPTPTPAASRCSS